MTHLQFRGGRFIGAAAITGLALVLSACARTTTPTNVASSPPPATTATTPAPSPTTNANLLGSVAVSIDLADGALPFSYDEFTLYVSRDGGPEVPITRVAPGGAGTGSFALTVPPGRYYGRHVTITASSISPQPIDIPIEVGNFVVPDTGCAYLGDVLVGVARLAPGSQSDQARQAKAFAQRTGASSEFVYLPSGGFIKDGYLDSANFHPPSTDPVLRDCVPTKMQ